jgi:membrane peptidoglycan carboxypeptidase
MGPDCSRRLGLVPFTPKRAGSLAYSLVMFVVVSVLAGVLVAGLFIPFAGMAGVTSNAAAAELQSLPAELATPAPATRSKVLMGNGKILAFFYDENRIPVKLNKIAPIMRQAQIAIEDHRFYEHGALDFKGTVRALVRNSAGDGITQGGSSITQQYVKMVQIEQCQAKGDSQCVKDAQAPTMERKIRELRYAIAMEKKFTKDEILERYLNIAYYGSGAYGVEAAAKHYFSTTASKLTLAQAAMLAGLVQNPDSNNPVRNPSAALDRRDVVLNRMVELKLITLDQAQAAKQTGFDQKLVKKTRNGCVGTRYPFLCDYVRRTLLNTPSLGKTEEDRENMINRGGLAIQTAIDPKIQDLAEKRVSAVVGPRDPVISTMNMIQPGTGLIIAMAQSRPVMGSKAKKGQTYWNLAADPAMGGIQGYQAGSTFKLFTLAAALEKGIPISKTFNAKSPFNFTGRPYTSCRGRERVWDRWVVRNAVGHSKSIGMMEAAQFSVNTYFIQLELATGMCRVTKMAQKAGVKVGARIGQPPVNIVQEFQDKPSFTLGTVEVSPLSMAEAYATFAARGIHCNPIIVSKITTRDGKNLAVPDANCRRVVDKDVADGVNKILKSVVDKGTGRRAKIYDGRDIAGKTGTIDSNEAVWFAGYTPEIAGVAMISIDNTKSPFLKGGSGYYRRSGVRGYRVPSTGVYLEGSGSGDAGMKIWKPVMQKYFQQIPKTSFSQPPHKIQVGEQVRVPSLSGLSVAAATRKLERLGFTVETQYAYSDKVPRYGFIGWSPSPGDWISEFGTIYAVYSSGRDPAVVAAEKAEARRKAQEEKKKQQQQQQEQQQQQSQPPKPPKLPPIFPPRR